MVRAPLHPATEIRFGEPLSRAAQKFRALWLCGPGLVWVSLFLLLPLLGIVAISFASRGSAGELEWRFTLENYRRLAGFGLFGFDPVYPMVLLRSVALGGITALLCALAGVPLAFFIASLSARWKTIALTLVVIPFWTNLLIRTYAWQILLFPDGWVTRTLAFTGLMPPDSALYPGVVAVLVAMVCDYLPFLVLPLYASVEKIDWSLAEAAADLGANRRQVFWHAVLPQIRPGLAAGVLLVFLPATGQFVIPDLLGGAKVVLLGNLVQQQFGVSRDWPFGSAIATVALGLLLLALWWRARSTREPGEAIAP